MADNRKDYVDALSVSASQNEKLVIMDLQIRRIIADIESEKDTKKRFNERLDEHFDKLEEKVQTHDEKITARVESLEKTVAFAKGSWIGVSVLAGVISTIIGFIFKFIG